jgi:hypothetical protein
MSLAMPAGAGQQAEPAFDQTFPPGALEGLLAKLDVGVVLLSADTTFHAAVRHVVGEHDAFIVVDQWKALLEAVSHGGCSVALLDADCLGPQLEARLAELERRPDAPVVIAAGGRDEAPALMRALSERRIHRLLIKPASPGKIRLLLEAAINHRRQRDTAARTPVAAVATALPPPRMLAVGALGAALLGIVVALMWPSVQVAPPAEPVARVETQQPGVVRRAATAPSEGPAIEEVPDFPAPGQDDELAADGVPTPGDEETADFAIPEPAADPAPSLASLMDVPLLEPAPVPDLDGLLALSQERLDAGRLVRPMSDNAFSYYRRAAALARDDARIVALRTRLGAAFVASIGESLEAGDADSAESLINWARELRVDATVLDGLRAQLATLHAAPQGEREAELLALALQRLRDGQYIAPAADSAAHYLVSLRAENPAHPGLPAPWGALTATLVANFRDSLDAADLGAAESWLAGLRQLEAGALLVGPLASELAGAQRQAQYLRVAVPSSELQLIDSRPVSYPRDARRRGLAGWVDVEFIVGRDGLPREIIVTDAQPPEVFEKVVTAAVAGYRYQPFEADGTLYERRVALKVSFDLD